MFVQYTEHLAPIVLLNVRIFEPIFGQKDALMTQLMTRNLSEKNVRAENPRNLKLNISHSPIENRAFIFWLMVLATSCCLSLIVC